MLCILPENSANDITLHIHFTLIEAFCWENDIRIIKVNTAYSITILLFTILLLMVLEVAEFD